MTLLFITLPAALIIAAGAVAAFIWAARDDQYEDLDTPPRRMLLEDPRSVPRRRQDAAAGGSAAMSAGFSEPERPLEGASADSV